MIDNAVKGVLNASGVNMRHGPDTKYGLADSNLKSGTKVTVYLRDGDWYFLKVDKTGKYGYIFADYIDLVDDDEPTPKPTTEPTDPPITFRDGDVNGDLMVSAADAALILRYVENPKKYSLTKAQLEAADMDGDGKVTILDAKALLKRVSNKLVG